MKNCMEKKKKKLQTFSWDNMFGHLNSCMSAVVISQYRQQVHSNMKLLYRHSIVLPNFSNSLIRAVTIIFETNRRYFVIIFYYNVSMSAVREKKMAHQDDNMTCLILYRMATRLRYKPETFGFPNVNPKRNFGQKKQTNNRLNRMLSRQPCDLTWPNAFPKDWKNNTFCTTDFFS